MLLKILNIMIKSRNGISFILVTLSLTKKLTLLLNSRILKLLPHIRTFIIILLKDSMSLLVKIDMLNGLTTENMPMSLLIWEKVLIEKVKITHKMIMYLESILLMTLKLKMMKKMTKLKMIKKLVHLMENQLKMMMLIKMKIIKNMVMVFGLDS